MVIVGNDGPIRVPEKKVDAVNASEKSLTQNKKKKTAHPPTGKGKA